MNLNYLDFEQPIAELQQKIEGEPDKAYCLEWQYAPANARARWPIGVSQ